MLLWGEELAENPKRNLGGVEIERCILTLNRKEGTEYVDKISTPEDPPSSSVGGAQKGDWGTT